MKKNKSQSNGPESRLKRLRVVLALFFFVSVSLVFLDIHGAVSRWLYDWGLYFQFVPSLICGVRALSLAASGFIVVLVLTLLFGRIYCSAICPLGILMDIIAFLQKKTVKKGNHGFTRPHTAVRYIVLTGTVLSFFSGSILLLNILDPFSNFGRMSVALAKPMVIMGNNLTSRGLETVGNYCVPPYPFKGIHSRMIAFTLTFAALIFYLAFTRGRLYCPLSCPCSAAQFDRIWIERPVHASPGPGHRLL